MTEMKRIKDVAITTLPDGGTYATIFYYEEDALGITAKKFRELMLKTDSGRKVEIFDLNQAAKVVFDRKFTEFVQENVEAFTRLGTLMVGKMLAESSYSGNPREESLNENFKSEIKAGGMELINRMEKAKVSFGELR
jgi:hypothetical protein